MTTFRCFLCGGNVPHEVPVCLGCGSIFPGHIPPGAKVSRAPWKKPLERAPQERFTIRYEQPA